MPVIRNITYGYRMSHGEIVADTTGAETVRLIFEHYLSGDSLGKIAAMLTAKNVCYRDNANTWNKNMVKRIIDCDKYIGANNYPPLISENEYAKATALKSERCTYRPKEKAAELQSPQDNIEIPTYRQSLEETKLRGEIGRELDKSSIDRERIVSLILKCAAAKYSALAAERS